MTPVQMFLAVLFAVLGGWGALGLVQQRLRPRLAQASDSDDDLDQDSFPRELRMPIRTPRDQAQRFRKMLEHNGVAEHTEPAEEGRKGINISACYSRRTGVWMVFVDGRPLPYTELDKVERAVSAAIDYSRRTPTELGGAMSERDCRGL